MNNSLYYLLSLILLVALIITIRITLSTHRHRRNKKTRKIVKDDCEQKQGAKLQDCILCGKSMGKGVKLVSKQVQRKDDSIIYIYGCTICAHTEIPKRCPVCNRQMNSTEYVIGRMWLREKTNKNHLHIAGCSQCARIKL